MNADQLISAVRIRGGITSTSTAWTTQQLLDGLNEDMWSYVVPALQAVNGEYFTDSQDTTLVANQQFYALPARAAAGAINSVKFIDGSGNESRPLPYLEVSETGTTNQAPRTAPNGYFFRGADIGLLPIPAAGSTGSLRMYYTLRPGQLVSDTVVGAQHNQVSLITSVTATVITTQAAHNGFPAGKTIDICDATPPHRLLFKDVTVTTATAGTSSITVSGVDLTTAIPSIAAGDTVTLADTAWYPVYIPVEWHTLLEFIAVARVLGSSGDLAGQAEVLRQASDRLVLLNSISQPRAGASQRRLNAWR